MSNIDIEYLDLVEIEYTDFSIYYNKKEDHWWASYSDKDVFENDILIDPDFNDSIKLYNYTLTKEEFKHLKEVINGSTNTES